MVLANGGVVRLSGWMGRVPAVLEGWLAGQAGGSATADLLFGAANPSGRLAETIPLRLADTPAHLDWPGENGHAAYGEGLFVGYRYYDTRGIEVSFPFGHGLSYTDFGYTNLRTAAGDDGLDVTVAVTNTGRRTGREVVQVYVGAPGSRVRRPARELKGFTITDLEPGETRDVTVRIPRTDLAYFDTAAGAWAVEGLDYRVDVGASSRDLRLSGAATVPGDQAVPTPDADSSLAVWLAHPVGGPALDGLLDKVRAALGENYPGEGSSRYRSVLGMRLSQIARLPAVPLNQDDLDRLIALVRAGG